MFAPVLPEDVPDLRDFLIRADLTQTGLDAPGVRLWLLRDDSGTIVGTTGYELSGEHTLIRSVAVDQAHRGTGLGLRLANFALDQAERAGARTAWLFSRRSGPFWQRLGFQPAEVPALAETLASTHQVSEFRRGGRLAIEVAWTRPLR